MLTDVENGLDTRTYNSNWCLTEFCQISADVHRYLSERYHFDTTANLPFTSPPL